MFDPAVRWHIQSQCFDGGALGQVVHGRTRATKAVCRAIQLRQASARVLARRYGVSPTTIRKRRKRETTVDAAMGPKDPRSTVLTPEEEAVVAAFGATRCCRSMIGLQPSIPHLTRSSLRLERLRPDDRICDSRFRPTSRQHIERSARRLRTLDAYGPGPSTDHARRNTVPAAEAARGAVSYAVATLQRYLEYGKL